LDGKQDADRMVPEFKPEILVRINSQILGENVIPMKQK